MIPCDTKHAQYMVNYFKIPRVFPKCRNQGVIISATVLYLKIMKIDAYKFY